MKTDQLAVAAVQDTEELAFPFFVLATISSLLLWPDNERAIHEITAMPVYKLAYSLTCS